MPASQDLRSFFFFQAEDGIRDPLVTGVQTCALPILEEYQEQEAEGTLEAGAKEPVWREWDVPTLRQMCIQANVNVVKLQVSEDSTFDYWLRISTLESGHPILVPVKLADYHKAALTDPKTGKRRP